MPPVQNKKGWQVSGNLTTGIPKGSSGGNISLQANFEQEPANYTVQFGVTAPPLSNSGDQIPFAAFGEITWSVEGNDIRRLVSIANGASVTAPAQGVKVIAYDESGTEFGNVSYGISIQVTKGSRPSVQQPPCLALFAPDTTPKTQRILVTPGSSLDIEIPRNAGVISIYPTVQSDPDSTLTPNVDYQIQEWSEFGIQKLIDPGSWVPTSPLATFFRLENQFPLASPSSPNLYFTLTLGIDG